MALNDFTCACGCGAALPRAAYPSQQSRWIRGHSNAQARMARLAERFWSRVNKTDGCWLWTGPVRAFGHGDLMVRSKRALAHRVSWEITNGAVPDGLFVLHKCDVPACVRPDHLFLGTQADNMADMTNKGRRAVGGRHGQSKLTAEDVALIKTTIRTRRACTELSRRLNIGRTVIYDIWNGKIWREASAERGVA